MMAAWTAEQSFDLLKVKKMHEIVLFILKILKKIRLRKVFFFR